MGVRLPEEYQKVEYLESSGGQYIVTDIPQKSGFRAKYEIEIVSHINDTQQIFAALNVNGNAIYYPYVSGGKWYYGYGVAQNTGVSVVAHNRYIIDSVLSVGEQTVKVDDVIIASGTNTLDINLAHKMHLFASNNVQNPRYAYARIYIFTVENSQANRLVANYIPCRRKSDSKPGMYDLVSGEFLVNQGTGEFLVGPDVIDSISPLMVAWRRMLMQKPIIGYTENVGFVPYGYNITPQEGHFVTGFIPFDLSNGAINATGRWGGTYSSSNVPFMVFYDENKRYLNYYSMSPSPGKSGERTVNCSVTGTKFIRFHGFMEYIDECYFRDNTHNVILWQKGM